MSYAILRKWAGRHFTDANGPDGIVCRLNHLDDIVVDPQADARVGNAFQVFQHQPVDGFRSLGRQSPVVVAVYLANICAAGHQITAIRLRMYVLVLIDSVGSEL